MMEQKVTLTDLHIRLIRIETRLVVLLKALGFDSHGVKTVTRQSNDERKVVHYIGGTR